jgi:hypothetical protein
MTAGIMIPSIPEDRGRHIYHDVSTNSIDAVVVTHKLV